MVSLAEHSSPAGGKGDRAQEQVSLMGQSKQCTLTGNPSMERPCAAHSVSASSHMRAFQDKCPHETSKHAGALPTQKPREEQGDGLKSYTKGWYIGALHLVRTFKSFGSES